MIFKVAKLELASHTVKELLSAELEGIKNGNMETPAVTIIAAKVKELLIKASPGLSSLDNNNVRVPITKADIGISHKIG